MSKLIYNLPTITTDIIPDLVDYNYLKQNNKKLNNQFLKYQKRQRRLSWRYKRRK